MRFSTFLAGVFLAGQLLAAIPGVSRAPVPAFPGAEGFGKYASGGRSARQPTARKTGTATATPTWKSS